MSHDPNESFDHAVLDLIENSPVGAVPSTPAYRDALQRIYAARQAYADADHKDGHVTARSLGRLPCFHAANLAELIAGRIGAEALEPNGAIFERYLRTLTPERRSKAEARRLAVVGRPIHHRPHKEAAAGAHDPVHSLFLIPGGGRHPGLPGNYLFGAAYETGAAPGAWAVGIHDNGDGAALFAAAGMQEALGKLLELIESAPFHMAELDALGFRML